MDRRTAARLKRASEFDRLVDVPTALDPIGGGHAHGDRALSWKNRADRFEDFQREAHPVLEAAAIFVRATVRERRQKLVQEVAVRTVELDRCQIEASSTLGCIGKSLANALEPDGVEFLRRIVAHVQGKWRWRDGLPAIRLTRRNLFAAEPRLLGRCLATRVAELDCDGHRGPTAHGREHPCHRFFIFIGPEARVTVGDPPFGRDGGCFDRQQRRARKREVAEMNHVPIGHAPVVGRILAHRRDHDAVGELEAADLQWAEQGGHGLT